MRLATTCFLVALLLLLVAAWRLYLAPFVGWPVLLYPLALLVGGYGEYHRLREGGGIPVRGPARMLVQARVELGCLLLIIVAGLIYRLWLLRFYAVTHGSLSDETRVATQAWWLSLHHQNWPLYVQTGGAVSFYQPLALAFSLFGASLTTMRVTSAMLGALLLPAFYMLARQFVAAPAALITTALLSCAYWPAAMGVLVFGWLDGLIFQAVSLSLLLFGIRRGSLTATTTSGCVAALCFYSYISHRLLAIPILLLVVLYYLNGKAPANPKRTLTAGFTIGFLSVLAPWIRIVRGDRDLLYGDTAN
ncbi:MAG: hypothetical protein ACRDGS_14215, partial [Chloroflexota bacterium]